ncbi:GTP-binding protein [Candidatus Microgenomates bacterium]|nr:GTP-binding protein [Candidatus Microgenomates bacterium]
MKPRGPIVTILGHVDHGKTTLLDYIRKTNITEREHGGITQGIGAYEIHSGIKGYPTDAMTFIDTPGHEAFSKLRARGATIADIALLIVDAKDSLMPQTVESISHIKASKTPCIIVANKSDLPDANPEKIKIDLMKYTMLVEDKGGDIPFVQISAKPVTVSPSFLRRSFCWLHTTPLNTIPRPHPRPMS